MGGTRRLLRARGQAAPLLLPHREGSPHGAALQGRVRAAARQSSSAGVRFGKGESMYLGAHVSIAENIALAPERGRAVGAEAIQIFSRSPRMLRKTKPLTEEETRGFRENMAKNGIARAVIHANYLINLGGPDDNTLKYSREAFVEELDRAHALGVHDVVFHPASHGGRGEAY